MEVISDDEKVMLLEEHRESDKFLEGRHHLFLFCILDSYTSFEWLTLVHSLNIISPLIFICEKQKQAFYCFCGKLRIFCLGFNLECMEI